MTVSAQARHWDKDLGGLLAGLTDAHIGAVSVTGLALDSRSVREGGLFLATAGRQRHGLEFAQQAWAAGAAAIAWEPQAGIAPPQASGGQVYIAVPGLARCAGRIAARFFEYPSKHLKIVGVTGTNGKTTTVHLLSRASRFLNIACGHMGTLGFGLSDPLTPSALTTPDVVTVHQRLAWLREQGASCVAMEVSSHALDQGRVDAVVFDTAVFTNLSRDHLDYHADLDEYGSAKRRLFASPGLQHAVVNMDDAYAERVLDTLGAGVRITAVGTVAEPPQNAAQWLRATRVTSHASGLRIAVQTSVGAGELTSPLLGTFNASNLLGALAVLLDWGAPLDEALRALALVTSPAGRMETFQRAGQPLLVVDYAHTPDALANAVRALRPHCVGELWCVFGCGGDRDRGKRALMAQAATLADRIIVTDDNPRHEDPERIVADILAGFPAATPQRVIRDRRKAIFSAAADAAADDVVLIAGKGHEGVQIVGSERRPLSDRHIVAELTGVAL